MKGDFGPDEGYRWVAEQINKKVAPKRIGLNRIRLSMARLMPGWVNARKKAAQKRLIRRVYAAPYYLFADHIDLNCKLSFSGGVKLYIYGQADGDSRYFRGLTMLFVKTARACYVQGYLPAIAEDDDCVADITTFDKGTEFNAIIFALEAQGCDVNLTTSTHNIRIERPWAETNVKCTRLHLRAVEAMEVAGIYVPKDAHHRYALRVTVFMCAGAPLHTGHAGLGSAYLLLTRCAVRLSQVNGGGT